MTEIKITGNKESYQLTRQVNYLEIKLVGDFDFNANTPIIFSYGDFNYSFNNRHTLFQFAEEMRGANFNKLLLMFLNRGMNIQNLTNNKAIENSLLKSIFLIYHWIELPLTSPFELNLKKQLHNEFIVDWTNQPEPQKDIYLIDEKYCIEKNQTSLNKLVDLNLIARLNVTTLNGTIFTSYFIPLVKPGVSRELFATASDTLGNWAYNLWQQILQDRNIKLSNWVNNRF